MNEDTKLGLLNIGTAAEYLGISIDTLRRWEKKGRIDPLRSPGGHRYYSRADLDALFGKRYTRDEETLRRTNEELGRHSGAQAIESKAYPEPADLSFVALAKEEVLAKESNLPNILEDPEQSRRTNENVPSVLPISEKPTQTPSMLHPIETQIPVAETTSSADPVLAVKETPKTPDMSVVSVTPATSNTADYMVPNILLPQKENNTLSEEEIEKRINIIIKKEEKRNYSNIVLGIVSFLMLTFDVILLYVWFTSSRITSPIP